MQRLLAYLLDLAVSLLISRLSANILSGAKNKDLSLQLFLQEQSVKASDLSLVTIRDLCFELIIVLAFLCVHRFLVNKEKLAKVNEVNTVVSCCYN